MIAVSLDTSMTTWTQAAMVLPHILGLSTIINVDGTVRSCNPDSSPQGFHWESRPPGTLGPYELCMLNGDVKQPGTMVYCPMGVPFVFGYEPGLPNG